MLLLGLVLVIISLAPWLFVLLGALAVPVFGPGALAVGGGAALLTCCLSPALFIIGIILVILGLFTSNAPQVVFVQPPPPRM
jgi:hypothetical protein